MTETDTRPIDPAARLLDIALRWLPARRQDWARAMRAELASLIDPSARRSFAVGCALAVVRQPFVLAGFGRVLSGAMVGTAAVVVAARIGDVRIRVESIGLVILVLGGGWRLARWIPAAPGRLATVVRAGGYVLVLADLCNAVYDWQHWPRGNLDGTRLTAFVAVPIETTLLLAHLVAVLVVTSHRAAIPTRVLALAVGCGAAAALGSFIPALIGTAIPRTAAGPVLLAVFAGVATAVISGWWTGRVSVLAQTGLWSAAIAAFGAAILDTGLYHVAPRWAPHIVDRVVLPGTSAADVLANNELEAGDPFVGVYLLSVVLVPIMLAATFRPASKPTGG